jgi:hypothetical protein
VPDDDWALAQGTVDFRNEERRAANGSEQIPPTGPRPQAASICPNCLTDLDADGYCDGCSYLSTIKRPA